MLGVDGQCCVLFLLCSELTDQLRCELDRVTTERDQLVAQVKTDADQLEGIVASVRSQGTSLDVRA